MATRRALRTYPDLKSFLEDLEGPLAQSAILLPADPSSADLHAELRLDLDVPYIGKIGPLHAQIVHRSADGTVALRVLSVPPDYDEAVRRTRRLVADVAAWLGRSPSPVAAVGEGTAAAPARSLPPTPAPAPSVPPQPVRGAAPAPPRGRGFPVPDLADQPPVARGARGDDSLRDALVRFSAEARTGLLTLRGPGGLVRYGFWDHGGPVGFRSDPVQESEVLGVLLYKAEQITREQLQESLRIMEADGLRQGDALIRMGVLTFPQLVMVLGKQTEFVLQQALQEREGSWTFHALPQLPERFLPPPLKVAAMLYRGLVQKAKDLRLDQLYESQRANLDRYVFVDEDRVSLLDELRLGATEKKLVDIVQSTSYRTREIFSVSPMSRAQTAAVMSALSALGFLVFRGEEDRSRTLSRARTRIEKKRSQVEKSSLFDVLECHWIALPREIDEAYHKVRAEYADAANPGLPPDLMEDLGAIQRRIEVAYETLRHDARRREYRETLIEKVMIQQSAELLAKRAEMALMRKDHKDAASCWAKAMELVPTNPEYREGLRRVAVGG